MQKRTKIIATVGPASGSQESLRALIEAGVPVRLCKGAYKEPVNLAFPKKVDVDQNMIDVMHLLLSEKALQNGARLAMATHDEKMIEATKAYATAHNMTVHRGKEFFSFFTENLNPSSFVN